MNQKDIKAVAEIIKRLNVIINDYESAHKSNPEKGYGYYVKGMRRAKQGITNGIADYIEKEDKSRLITQEKFTTLNGKEEIYTYGNIFYREQFLKDVGELE